MIASGTLGHKFSWGILLAVCGIAFSGFGWAQSEDAPVPLGDVARSLRKKKDQAQAPQPGTPLKPARPLIDNDNFNQMLDEAEALHITHGNFLYTFDGTGRNFQVTSPDVSCSLSFNSHAASLLSRPFLQMDLPEDELRKLDGPATISDEGLQIAVFNGTQWQVQEITIGLTLVRRANPAAGFYGKGRLVPAASETTIVSQKPADSTTLYHLKANAQPSATTIFKTPLSAALPSDQEWHWAIIQAKGFPPKPENSALKTPLAPTNNAVIP